MKFPCPSIITIDGPAASGKTTVGNRVANTLGYLFFDTGVMYRAVTWLALQRGLDVHDAEAMSALAETVPIEVKPPSKEDGRASDVWVEGKDITWEVRAPNVTGNVSTVSAHAGVRAALTRQQRRIGLRGRVVMVGRDIGTVVLPEAPLKIYLDASAEIRARRRYEERLARGENADYDALLQNVIERDRIDSTRAVAPLRPAEDAHVIQTDSMSIEEVYETILSLCNDTKKD